MGKGAQGGFHRGVVLSASCFYENDSIGLTKHLKSKHLR